MCSRKRTAFASFDEPCQAESTSGGCGANPDDVRFAPGSDSQKVCHSIGRGQTWSSSQNRWPRSTHYGTSKSDCMPSLRTTPPIPETSAEPSGGAIKCVVINANAKMVADIQSGLAH